MPKTVTKAGCLFCGKTQIRVGAINSHLDSFVPEIASAKGLLLQKDAYHNVAIIREGRYPDRALWGSAPASGKWLHPRDKDERKVLAAFGKSMVVKVPLEDSDSHENRPWSKIFSAYWSEAVHDALQEYKSGDHDDRDSVLNEAVQSALQDALFVDKEPESPAVSEPSPAASPVPVRRSLKASRGAIVSEGAVAISGLIVNTKHKQQATSARTLGGQLMTPAKRRRMVEASPATPVIDVQYVMILDICLLGSTNARIKVHVGETLHSVIQKAFSIAATGIPFMNAIAHTPNAMVGDSESGPAGVKSAWRTCWTEHSWQKFVQCANSERSPPTWKADVVLIDISFHDRDEVDII